MVQSVHGTQTVTRALALLKLVAARHPEGVGIRLLSETSELDRTTAYRLVSTLVQAGFVSRDARKLYRLGLQSMQLGLAAMSSAPLVETCAPMMQRLAALTEDTVFLVVRSGDYAHCLHYEEGSYPIKALVLQIGGMRVLGIGSAGMTLLSRLPDDDIESLYKRHRPEFEPRHLSLSKLRHLAALNRKHGFSSTVGLVAEGVGGVGMAFELPHGGYAAVSIAAIASRMTERRRAWIAEQISEALIAADFKPASKLPGAPP